MELQVSCTQGNASFKDKSGRFAGKIIHSAALQIKSVGKSAQNIASTLSVIILYARKCTYFKVNQVAVDVSHCLLPKRLIMINPSNANSC